MATNTIAGDGAPIGKRRGSVKEVVIGALVLVLIGGTWLGMLLVGPQNTAIAYASAVMRGDANAAWPLVYIDRDLLHGSNSEVLTKPAFAATLTSRSANVPNLKLNDLKFGADLSRASADLTYADSGTTEHLLVPLISKNEPFRAHRAYFVDIQPGVIRLGLPRGAGALAIDGVPVGTPSVGSLSIAVFPGHHRISLAASDLFAAQTKEADVGLNQAVDFSFDGLLTPKGQTAAATSIDSAVAACAAQGSSIPSGCPMSDLSVNTTARVKWESVGEPASWMSYAFDPSGQFFAEGHYQMILSTGDAARAAEGGPFYLFLDASGDGFKVAKMYADVTGGVPLAARPQAATDQLILASLRPLFQACAASTDYNPVNCPQFTVDFSATWALNGDPLAGAKVTFDGDHGYFVVSGNCSFTETGRYPKTAAGPFVAYVFWDGTKPAPVKIRGPIQAL
jgi:hypothetical protein